MSTNELKQMIAGWMREQEVERVETERRLAPVLDARARADWAGSPGWSEAQQFDARDEVLRRELETPRTVVQPPRVWRPLSEEAVTAFVSAYRAGGRPASWCHPADGRFWPADQIAPPDNTLPFVPAGLDDRQVVAHLGGYEWAAGVGIRARGGGGVTPAAVSAAPLGPEVARRVR